MELEQGHHSTAPENTDGSHNSWSNPRKRSHNATEPGEVHGVGHADFDEADSTPGRGSKRSRSAKWPLPTVHDEESMSSRGLRSRRVPTSPSQKRHSNSTPRPSKFLEGSMNDRASNRPPTPYLGEEQAMEQYSASNQTSTRASEDITSFYDAGIESSRPSGMYRFGKAIANVFNPVSAWRGINGRWKEKEKSTVDPEKAARQELQEKAEKKYAELKKTGFKGTQGASRLSATDGIPVFKYDSAQSSRVTSFQDSAVDLDEYRPSVDHTENPRMSESDQGFMPAPNVPLISRSVSPMPNASGRRSSLNFRSPSFQSLKKATSHIQLPSVKRLSAQSDISDSSQQLKKQPSKKDLAKQQKLSKRISNLETQLETARRQFEQARNATSTAEPVGRPAKKAFVPGNLPSLPSERILNARLEDDELDNDKKESGYMVTRSADKKITSPASQLQHELVDSTAAQAPSSRKRRGRPRIEKSENTTAKPTLRPRASQKIEFPNLQPARPLRRTTSGLQNTPPTPHKEPSPKPPTRRSRPNKDIPPVPSLPVPISPASVDKVAIIAMRGTPNISAGFGQLPEDALNLRKAYPFLTDTQVSDLLGKFGVANSKITDYTSTAHHNAPRSPALGPPQRSTSPIKDTDEPRGFKPSISKTSLRSAAKEVNAPNNSPVDATSVKGRTRNGGAKLAALSPQSREEAQDVVAELSPSKSAEKELPPYPREDAAENVRREVSGEEEEDMPRGGGEGDETKKALPEGEKEDFAWDEDVF